MKLPVSEMTEAMRRFVDLPTLHMGALPISKIDQVREYLREAQSLINAAGEIPLISGSTTGIIGGVSGAMPSLSINAVDFRYTAANFGRTNEIVDQLVKAKIRTAYAIAGSAVLTSTATMNVSSAVTGITGVWSTVVAEAGTSERDSANRRSWLWEAYAFVRQNENRKAMRAVFSAVDFYIERSDIRGLDEALAETDISRLNPQVMAALLRVTARAKEALQNWNPLLTKVKHELQRLGTERPDRLLVGLE